MEFLESVCRKLVGLQGLGFRLVRIAIAVILIWIGGLKFFDYEAEGIVPFVANSPARCAKGRFGPAASAVSERPAKSGAR